MSYASRSDAGRRKRGPGPLAAATIVLLAFASCACTTVKQIRIENASSLDFTDVSVAGVPFGDIAFGATSGFKDVPVRFRYGVIRLTATGYDVNAQTLNLGARRFTYRIAIKDLRAGHLDVEVIRHESGADPDTVAPPPGE